MADVITSKAAEFIAKNKQKPFFLYFATHDIHVPRAPHQRFIGTSDCGVRGDVIAEFDWSVGEIMKTLDEQGLADNTLLIVTSDNGPIVDDGYDDGAWEALGDHDPSGPLRGNKYSHYEAGTAVPCIARWPGRIGAGTTSDALLCQIDCAASFAQLVGVDVPEGAAPDSENMLPALLGEAKEGRDVLVEQGRGLALRQGRYKYIPAAPNRKRGGFKARPFDDAGPDAELYDVKADVSEQKNLAKERPETVKEMDATLKRIQNQ
jgi:arylsulfatase A-like enzyme